ncbi:sel1 repeat family protein [Vreelandella populi]|nr:sel1 repeat family protein [Halomonas populi]
MMLFKRFTTVATLAGLALVALTLPSAWALNEEAQTAKNEGMRLYNAHQREASIPYLEKAAEAGDIDAMFYLGHISHSQEWLYRAAQKGEVYAMLYLREACERHQICPDEGENWIESAVSIALERAEAGDIEAMFALYPLYATLEYDDEPLYWLEKSAEAGNVEAQLKLGGRIRNDQSNYPDEASRLNAAEGWFRRAAEAGYPRAMSSLSRLLHEQGNDDEAWEWMTSASNAGHINARQWLAYCYIEPSDKRNAICQVEQDPAEGWAILLAVNEEAPNIHVENALHYFEDSGKITPEEREEGERRMMEWLNREPPLSYFPMKFFGP